MFFETAVCVRPIEGIPSMYCDDVALALDNFTSFPFMHSSIESKASWYPA